METFFLEPESFNFYIAMDPSIWWNGYYYADNSSSLLEDYPAIKTKIWFAASDAEDISEPISQLATTLKNNAPSTLIWKYSAEPNEQHNTIFRATKEKALVWTLN
jgi:predicted alpha/beta superfamily hydrolase